MRLFSQKLKIEGRVALITGAANGIGRSVARQIKEKGGVRVCVDLPSVNLDSLAVELGANAMVTCLSPRSIPICVPGYVPGDDGGIGTGSGIPRSGDGTGKEGERPRR